VSTSARPKTEQNCPPNAYTFHQILEIKVPQSWDTGLNFQTENAFRLHNFSINRKYGKFPCLVFAAHIKTNAAATHRKRTATCVPGLKKYIHLQLNLSNSEHQINLICIFLYTVTLTVTTIGTTPKFK
jgi:hypothetical protein